MTFAYKYFFLILFIIYLSSAILINEFLKFSKLLNVWIVFKIDLNI